MEKKKLFIITLSLVTFCSAGCLEKKETGFLKKGNLYYEEKNYDDALSAYQHVLEENPNNIDAHFRLGVIHQRRKNIPSAIQEYNTVIKLDPSHAKAHFNLALIYSDEQVDLIKAIYFMEKFIELAPSHSYIPEAKKRIEEMKKKAYNSKEPENTENFLDDLTDELIK